MSNTQQITVPSFEITAPAVVPYPNGLFAQALTPLPDVTHWQAGVHWFSQACAAVGITYDPCVVDAEVPAKVLSELCGTTFASAVFTLYARSGQSAGQFDAIRRRVEARSAFNAGEQFGAEAALWDVFDNTSPAVTFTPDTIVEAVALVEMALAAAYGGTGVIHMSRYVATLAAKAGVIDRESGNLITSLGTPVVAGGGYAPNDLLAPADEFSIFGTGALVMLRSDVKDLGEVIDATNTAQSVVERAYVIGWDCALVRADVTQPEPPPDEEPVE